MQVRGLWDIEWWLVSRSPPPFPTNAPLPRHRPRPRLVCLRMWPGAVALAIHACFPVAGRALLRRAAWQPAPCVIVGLIFRDGVETTSHTSVQRASATHHQQRTTSVGTTLVVVTATTRVQLRTIRTRVCPPHTSWPPVMWATRLRECFCMCAPSPPLPLLTDPLASALPAGVVGLVAAALCVLPPALSPLCSPAGLDRCER
jgi:hypothetical protein